MSGFEVFNDQGASVINSDQKHTMFQDIKDLAIGFLGDYAGATKFGDLSELGYPASINDYRKPEFLYWGQFKSPSWCYPGAELYKPNSMRIIRTTHNLRPVSGYMDVFDSAGTLIWTARSAGTMPRITGFLDVPNTSDLNNNIISYTPGYNPFILLNSCPGSIAYPEAGITGFSGAIIRWTGSQLQTTWINRNQANYNTVFGSRGNFRILCARFTGYN